MFKYFLLWLPMPLIASINATIREIYFVINFSEKAAYQMSTVTILILLAIYVLLALNKWEPETLYQSVLVGLLWCFLTVAFEFGLGLLTGRAFNEMLQVYVISSGELWTLVPLFVLVSPSVFYLIFVKR